MIQAILELFTTEQKAEEMLASPMIEFIFMALFVLFIITLIAHFTLFFKIKNIRNYVKDTNRLDIEPLQTFKQDFDQRQTEESMKVETFVQEKISSWRLLHVPVVSLIKLVQMTISVFILLGVLGTFIGLTISLGSIQMSGDQLVENISGVLSGIDVAFYTSIVGMGFSLIMTMLVRVFNTEYLLTDLMLKLESHLEGHEQHGMNRMIDVSELIHQAVVHLQETNEQSLQGIVQAFDGFKDYTAGLQQSAKDLAAFNDGLSENLTVFQTLFQEMKIVTDGFEAGTTQLNKNFDTLFSHFQKADRRNERMVSVFEHTYENIQNVQEAQINSFTEFDASVFELKDFTSSLLNEQKEVHQALDTITKRTSNLVDMMGEHDTKLSDIFGNDLHTKLTSMTAYIGELAQKFDKVGTAIVTLPQALEVINETQAEHKHLLKDRFRELQAFNETFNEHIKNHASESSAFDKHMRDATTSYEQMTEKNLQLITEMNRTIGQVNQTFTQRDHQLESNITMLKDTLANYVSSLEGTLGQKLDTVIRNIENNMYQKHDGMNREFTEMRRISEEINQNHARAIQQLLQDLTREIQTMNRQLRILGQSQVDHRPTGLDQHE